MKSFFACASANAFISTYGLNGFFSSMINSMKKSRFLIISASTCLLDEKGVCGEDMIDGEKKE
jgi:hypothetical protein